jgi:hypothetical protein
MGNSWRQQDRQGEVFFNSIKAVLVTSARARERRLEESSVMGITL